MHFGHGNNGGDATQSHRNIKCSVCSRCVDRKWMPVFPGKTPWKGFYLTGN